MHSPRRFIVSLLFMALVCALGPFVMDRLGFHFQSLDLGGVGDSFAGYYLDSAVLRLDLILLMGGGLGLACYFGLRRYQRQDNASLLLAITLAMSALVAAVQVLDLPPGGTPEYMFRRQVFHATQLASALAGATLLAGAMAVRWRRRLSRRWGPLLLMALGLIMLAVSLKLLRNHEPSPLQVTLMHAATLLSFAGTAGLLIPELRRQPVSAYVVAMLAGLLPLTVNQVGFLHPDFYLDSGALNRMAILQWFAYLIPLLGLCIDLARGVAGHTQAREQAYLRRVIDALPDLVFARDEAGRFCLLNRTAAEFLGGTRVDLEGRSVHEIDWDPEVTDRALAMDRRILATGRTVRHPGLCTLDAAGEQRILQLMSMPLASDDGPPDQVLGVATDVTRLKAAERVVEERLRSERTLRRCLALLVRSPASEFESAMQEVLAEVGRFCAADSTFVYHIDQAAGLARQVFLWTGGRTPSRPTHDLRRLTWALEPLSRGETVIYADPEHLPDDELAVAMARRLGTRFLVLAPVFASDGTLWGVLGAHCPEPPQPDCIGCRQILAGLADLYTQARSRFLAETRLQLAKETAENSSQAKSEFLANMSHEIRTPLNAVIGLSDILNGLDPTAEQSRYLQMIQQAGESLLGVINDILDFSKIEAGQLALDPVETDLPALLSEVVDMMAYHAQQQGLELVYHLEPDARLRVTCDPVRLKQILLNLLNNAIKFTEAGHVALRVSHHAGETRFVVADTGIGIPAAKLTHIFDKFTQADASHTRKYGGTGLGLAICHSLVTMMDGRLEVRSAEDRGTTFTVILPLSGEIPVTRGPLPDPVLAGKRYLVQLIDAAARGAMTAYLGDLGLSGEAHHDVPGTLAALSRRPCDVMLVDGQLDSVLLEKMRRALSDLPAARRPRLVLMAPLGDHQDQASRSSWDAVLHKPARRSTLRQALRAVVAPHAVAVPEADEEQGQICDGTHVLLVEDNVFNQKVATRLLETLGCRVTVAEDGRQAVDAAGGTVFDLILMDCQMPVMDGLEATRLIRELGDPHGAVPVVAMTANVLGEHRDACLRAGMDDFASKPVNKKTLRLIVEQWVGDRVAAPLI